MNTCLEKNAVLYRTGETGAIWRIQSGIVTLHQNTPNGTVLIQLALPGDILGAETLCGEGYAYTAVAMQPCTLIQPEVVGDFQRFSTVAQGYLQQQQRLQDMVKLRTGTVSSRVGHLLGMLRTRVDGSWAEISREDLPTLKEMASMLDTAAETICRELNHFLPKRVAHKPAVALTHLALA